MDQQPERAADLGHVPGLRPSSHPLAQLPEALDHAVREYAVHYNTERPHQGVGNVPLGPWEPTTEGQIVCDQRLGGILKSFRRAA